MKTTTIQLDCKDPDVFGDMALDLNLTDAKRNKFLEFGEYATIELTVSDDMTFVGRFVQKKR